MSGVGSTKPHAGDAGPAGASHHDSARAMLLLSLADDELILGWRDSEWTGIAPTLEEDVAFSSIAQNEIGHARALYELAAAELDTDADALAFDRAPSEYRCAPLVELRLIDDWALTIARRYLYEEADRVRIEALTESDDTELAGLAAKIDREEVYHRLHAELWAARLRDEPRFTAAVDRLWPFALAVVDPPQREELARRVGRPSAKLAQTSRRGTHTSDLTALWEEMTEVRRSEPGAQW
ncbi:MAG TPA: 1,2-phenylacetyl-CoA epoxidase subunit PaaC [Gaiellaceae bacterium]|nr:1,2-phenylacetyl-CoA epoxidase subunit PaaC [Gaiellaceae bacterium]